MKLRRHTWVGRVAVGPHTQLIVDLGQVQVDPLDIFCLRCQHPYDLAGLACPVPISDGGDATGADEPSSLLMSRAESAFPAVPTVVPAWVTPPPADVVAAHRIAAGFHRDRLGGTETGGAAAVLHWLRGYQHQAPVTGRTVPADLIAVQGEALAADRLVQRATGRCLFHGVLLGVAPAEIPVAVVDDVGWADGVVAACAWLLGVVTHPPVALPAVPAPDPLEAHQVLADPGGGASSPEQRQRAWAAARQRETWQRVLADYATADPTPGIISPGTA